MKIETEGQEMTEQEKKHAFKILGEMLYCINNIEESYIYFCTDEDNKIAAHKLMKQLKDDMNINQPIEEAIVYFSVFKAKIMSEHKRLNISINKLN